MVGQEQILFQVMGNGLAEGRLGTLPKAVRLLVLAAELQLLGVLRTLLGAGRARSRHARGTRLRDFFARRANAYGFDLRRIEINNPAAACFALDSGGTRVQHQQRYTLDQFFASAVSSKRSGA